METITKLSDNEYTHIFQTRKQTSPYTRIPLDTRNELIEQFSKVIIFELAII